MGKDQYVGGMWEISFAEERDRVNMFRASRLKKKMQAGMQGQWQLESPAREYLEQIACRDDTHCTERMMKRELCHLEKWRLARIQKHFQGSFRAGRKAKHCARNHDQKHGLPAAHHCASWETRMRYNVLLVPELQQLSLGRLHLVCFCGIGRNNWWCAIRGEKYDWMQPNRLLVGQTG